MNKNNMGDPIQLQQKIIHFKAELAKYKEKVKDYQENYHYAQLDDLKEQNIQLLEDKAALDYQVEKMEQELRAAEEIIAEQQSDRSRLQIKNKSLQELLQKQESEFRVQKENLTFRIEHLLKEKEKVQNKLIELEQSNRALNDKNTKITKELEGKRNSKKDSKEWDKWKQAKEETIEALTQDNMILKAQVEKLKQKLESN
ncbi:hypothetical protein GCM10007216_32810 [Thalassobacillus devorans]|uniref:Uncharacterized protein n=1 Tax=Thalassobacillus devorans TaxID=279813 RepID=A0ABQ1PLX0_9BACI|nr:hypothetical protein [Thalassobacillus devorans]NIK30241.1 chromosome segregation ATPase [Thalassobacillus devorans]GGC99523.1 hypothetical protein GCM10007216_32810 [Thalassobacillus devorans]